jgi:hypothetical protein
MDSTKAKSQESFKITEHWNEQAKALRSKYVQLTETDVKCAAGFM